MDVTALIVAMSIPSAITGFCFWMLQKHLEKREKRQDERRLPGKRMRYSW